MKYALIVLLLGGCGSLQVSSFGSADEHSHSGKSWYIADRKGQLSVASMSGGYADPADQYRAAALDYLLQRGRVCSLGNGWKAGGDRYLFDYTCS
jgi:hypothetical protein